MHPRFSYGMLCGFLTAVFVGGYEVGLWQVLAGLTFPCTFEAAVEPAQFEDIYTFS